MKAIISKAARRKWAWILALVMTVSIVIPTSLLTVKAEVNKVVFNGTAEGWLESAYAEWNLDNNADGYVAYVKEAEAADSAYVKVDNELLRKYPNHWRVDVVGLIIHRILYIDNRGIAHLASYQLLELLALVAHHQDDSI